MDDSEARYTLGEIRFAVRRAREWEAGALSRLDAIETANSDLVASDELLGSIRLAVGAKRWWIEAMVALTR